MHAFSASWTWETSCLAQPVWGYHVVVHSFASLQAEKLEERLFAANAKVDHLQKARRHDRCVCAFVTFMEEKGRASCLAANPNTVGRPERQSLWSALPFTQHPSLHGESDCQAATCRVLKLAHSWFVTAITCMHKCASSELYGRTITTGMKCIMLILLGKEGPAFRYLA